MVFNNLEMPFTDGFVGPPVAPDQTGAGCPDWQNVMLTLGKGTFEQMPGFRRTYLRDLMQGTLGVTRKLRVVSFPPDAIGITGNGRGIGVVDEWNGRVLGLAYHPGGIPITNGATNPTPVSLGELNRQGNSDYPATINYKMLTHVSTPWDVQKVFDGAVLRNAGVRKPQIAPTRKSTTSTTSSTETTTSTTTTIMDDGSTIWTKGSTMHAATEIYVETATDNAHPTVEAYRVPANPPPDDAYIYIRLDKADRFPGIVAYHNVSGTLDKDHVNFVFMDFRVRSKRGNLTNQNQFSLVLYSELNCGGSQVILPLNGSYPTDQWVAQSITHFTDTNNIPQPFLNLPAWIGAAGYKSIALKSNYAIDEKHFFNDDKVYFGLDNIGHIDTVQTTTTVVTTTVESLSTDRYQFMFSWYDSERAREGPPSPISNIINLAVGGPTKIDLSGYFAGITAGLVNSNPETGIVDSYRLYVSKLGWGVDDLGRPLFKLLKEDTIPTPGTNGELLVDITAIADEVTLLASADPQWNNDPPPAAGVIVVDGERLIMSGVQGYSRGKVRVCSTADASPTFDPHIVKKLKAYRRTVGGVDTLAYFYATPPVVSPVWVASPDDEAQWGPHLEGREIRIASDGVTYFIVKALWDAAAIAADGSTGDYSGLYIGTGESLTGYAGTSTGSPADPETGAYGTAYGIQGYPNRLYFTTKETFGANQEAVGIFNFYDLDMAGDEIIALGHVGDFLMVLGRRHVFYLLQDNTALDDFGQAPFTNPRLVYGSPGCIAGRSLAILPGRQAMYLCEGPAIALAGTEGCQIHPLSTRLEGWLIDAANNDPRMLRYCHAVYDQVRQWYVLFLQESPYSAGVVGALLEQSDTLGAVNQSQYDPAISTADTYVQACPEYGAAGYSGVIVNDFSRMAVLDMLAGVAYIGQGWNISCTLANSSPCAVMGATPDKIFGGDTTGHLNKIFADDAYGLGVPLAKIRWKVTAGNSSSVTVNVVQGGLVDGGDGLVGLPVTLIHADGTSETRTITTPVETGHSNGTLNITPDWDVDPIYGDALLIAPMLCRVRFGEFRLKRAGYISGILPNFRYTTSYVPEHFGVRVWSAIGKEIQVNYVTPVVEKVYGESDLKSGLGRVLLPPKNSKALSLELFWFAIGKGTAQIGPVRVYLDLHPLDPLRNQKDTSNAGVQE